MSDPSFSPTLLLFIVVDRSGSGEGDELLLGLDRGAAESAAVRR
jgi:hypothetical protein